MAYSPPATITLDVSAYRALRERIRSLEEQLRIERERRHGLEETARQGFKLAAWGGAKATPNQQ